MLCHQGYAMDVYHVSELVNGHTVRVQSKGSFDVVSVDILLIQLPDRASFEFLARVILLAKGIFE